ncbi:MAG: amidase family protein, partial [Actinomycetota bacterium]|nr:amidase family protein [Actinomycetota bacterium]
MTLPEVAVQLDEYARLDATGLAGLIRSGSLSATEAVQLALDAADRVNPELNAIIHPRYERALEEARSAGGNDDAPFAGVPIVLK